MSETEPGPPRPYEMTEAAWRAAVNRVRAGRALKPAHWPGGARCAVALSFDCDHETFELGRGVTAVGRLSWGEFGRRVGVPRILDLLDRHGVPASFFVPAVAGLIDPSEPRRIVEAGHEVAMHGYIHENTALLDPATERELMLRARDALAGMTGRDPVGFRAANWDLGEGTIATVAEMGLLYDSSLMADENCYELLVEGRPSGVVEVPVEWLRDDAVYLMFNRTPATRPWTPPDDVLAIFRRELDAAFREGGLFQLVCHPFVIAHRSRIFILEALIEQARSLGPVWFATHAEVAAWVRDHG